MTDLEREKMILDNIGLAHKEARKYSNLEPNLDYDDLLQSGYIGLIKAVDKFDPEKGSFATYATYWILREILRFLDKSNNYLSGIDTNYNGAFRVIHKIIEDLKIKKGQYSTDFFPLKEEIKNHPDFEKALKRVPRKCSKEELSDKLIERYKQRGYIYFYGGESGTKKTLLPLSEIDYNDFLLALEDKTEDFTEIVNKTAFINDTLLSSLPAKYKTVIELYYGLNPNYGALTLQQIGDHLNLTRSAIGVIHKKALKILKEVGANYPDYFIEE